MTFWTEFESMVDRNIHFNYAQKVYLLRLNLGTKPSDAIKHLPQNQHGYDEALVILKKKYNRPELIEYNIINRFNELGTIRDSEDLDGISSIMTSLEFALNQLHLLESNAIEREIIKLVRKILPIHLKEKLVDLQITTIKELHDVLSVRYEGMLSQQKFIDLSKSSTTKRSRHDRDPYVDRSYHHRRVQNFHISAGTSSSNTKSSRHNDKSSPRCRLCQQKGHFGHECIINNTPEKKMEVIKKRNLCSICFMDNHVAKDCYKKHLIKCNQCDGPHYPSICALMNESNKRKVNESDSDTQRGKRMKLSNINKESS